MIKILLLSDFAREPERRLLRGLVEYANEHGGAKLYPVTNFIQNDRSKAHIIIDRARALKVDAIFGRWPGIDEEAAKKLGIPVVLRTIDKDYKDFPMLSGNYEEIGRKAAQYYLRQHYDSFAFFGLKDYIWSEKRLNGFKSELGETHTFSTYELSHIDKEWEQVGKWLQSLPKPTALYACNDVHSKILSEICLEKEIRIPEDIALLGTDDDDFLCNISTPTLSSLKLDFESQGRELGKVLFEMIEKGQIWPARIRIDALDVTERDSTMRHHISNPYIARIVERIDSEYDTISGIDELIEGIPLSRRALELKFKKEMAPDTIGSYLAQVRMKKLCSLLSNTDIPIEEAGEKVGIIDPFYVGKVFRRYFNTSPSEYRKAHRKR